MTKRHEGACHGNANPGMIVKALDRQGMSMNRKALNVLRLQRLRVTASPRGVPPNICIDEGTQHGGTPSPPPTGGQGAYGVTTSGSLHVHLE